MWSDLNFAKAEGINLCAETCACALTLQSRLNVTVSGFVPDVIFSVDFAVNGAVAIGGATAWQTLARVRLSISAPLRGNNHRQIPGSFSLSRPHHPLEYRPFHTRYLQLRSFLVAPRAWLRAVLVVSSLRQDAGHSTIPLSGVYRVVLDIR